MSVIRIVSLIISLLTAAVLLFFGIYGLVNNVSLGTSGTIVKYSGVTEWVFVGLGIVLVIFSVWDFVISQGVVNLENFFGVKKVETKTGEETQAVPPEGMKEAIKKFEDTTGISVKGATAVSASPRKSPPAKEKKRSRSRSKRRSI